MGVSGLLFLVFCFFLFFLGFWKFLGVRNQCLEALNTLALNVWRVQNTRKTHTENAWKYSRISGIVSCDFLFLWLVLPGRYPVNSGRTWSTMCPCVCVCCRGLFSGARGIILGLLVRRGPRPVWMVVSVSCVPPLSWGRPRSAMSLGGAWRRGCRNVLAACLCCGVCGGPRGRGVPVWARQPLARQGLRPHSLAASRCWVVRSTF